MKLQRKYCGVVSHQPKSPRFDPRYRSAWRSCTNLHATAATKADDDSLYRSEALELDNSFISIGDGISSVVGAVIEEAYYAIKGDSLQIRCEGDNTNVIF